MKKALLLPVILMLCAALWASAFDAPGGQWFSLGGRSDSVLQASGGLEVYLVHAQDAGLFLFLESYVQLSDTALEFGGARAGAGLELFYLKDHPLGFISANPTAWAPALLCGCELEDGSIAGYVQLSLLRFMEKDAVYEYLTPFVSIGSDGLFRPGILVFRCTGLW